MAQHDYVIANGTGAAVRSDLNNALAAIVSQNSGATEPATTYAYQWWADTTTNLLKLRNSANSGWITLFQLDGEWSTIALENGTAGAPSLYFKDSGTDTGFYSPGANQVGVSTGGTARLTIDSNGNVDIDSNTLYVDAANNRVGLGTSSPGATLHVSGSGNLVRLGDGTNTFDVRFQGPNNWDLQLDTSADKFNIRRNSSSLVTVDGAGRLGIGTTSPGSYNSSFDDLVVATSGETGITIATGTSSNGTLAFADGTTGDQAYRGFVQYSHTSDALVFGTSGNDRGRFDSSGRFLVGTSTSRGAWYNTGSGEDATLQVEGGGGNAVSLTRNVNSASGAYLNFGKSRGTTNGSNTVVQSGDILGTIDFQGADGSEMVEAALIKAEVDGTPGSNDMPGRLVFSTTADGASSPTERMRISEAGHILGGGMTSLTAGSSVKGFNFENSTNNGRLNLHANSSAGTANGINFYHSGAGVGSITYSSTNTAYNTSSDYRLKENVVPLTGAADRVNQLQVHRFNFIADPGKTVDGFIAHEAQIVVPECVTGTKDEVDADGNPVYQGIDQSKLVPLLTAALQEAIAKIETLEARLTAAGI